MNRRLVKVATYNSAPQAYAVSAFLQSQGIESVVTGEESATLMSYVGVAMGGVQLLVNQDDASRAAELIATMAEPAPPSSAARAKCPACSEKLEPGFEVCWKCGASLDGQPDPSFRSVRAEEDNNEENGGQDGDPHRDDPDDDDPDDDDSIDAGTRHAAKLERLQRAAAPLDREPPADAPAWVCSACRHRVSVYEDQCWSCGTTQQGHFNPYQSPSSADDAGHHPSQPVTPANELLDAQATRAWRAAVIGTALCPPILNLYSLWLSLDLSLTKTPLSPFAKKRLFGAYLINAMLVILILIFRRDVLFIFMGMIRFVLTTPLR